MTPEDLTPADADRDRLEFEIEWAALFAEEREAFIALMEQRRRGRR
jgi:hypothetical protein